MAIQERLPDCPDPRFLNIFGSSFMEFSYRKKGQIWITFFLQSELATEAGSALTLARAIPER